MKLTILSLQGVEFDGEAAGLTVQTLDGEITVLDRHRPLITVLAPGTARITTPQGERVEIAVKSGFLEMGAANELSLLIEKRR